MKKYKLLLLVLCVNLLSVNAQIDPFKNYTYLKSSGKIPQNFLTLTTEKFYKDLKNNQNKELDKDFFLSTRFFLDEILLSGNVLFNDPLSNYVNKVAKYLLRKNKDLFNKLQFYVLKSNTVNAFSTDQGILFITTGLLSQLENEAQLAFVLGHEIAHYTEKHVRNGYVDKQQIIKGKGDYKGLSYSEKIDELNVYSKDNEFEADKIGVEFYLNSEYDLEEIYSAMGVLLYSYLPFEEIQFDTAFFNTEILNVPGIAFPDSIKEITTEEDFDDDLSTHPNVRKRMDAIFDVIGDKKSRGNLKYKISEEEFKKVRNLARFESVNIDLANRNYVDALYSIFLLQRNFEDNKFLEFSKAKALYGLAKYKNHNRYYEVIRKPKKTEGEMYKLATFFKKITKKQLNVLAYRHIYDLSLKYKDDPLIKKYERSMMKEFALYSTIKKDELIATDFKTYNDSITKLKQSFDIQDSIRKIDESDLSKYKKIRLKKELRKLEGSEEKVIDDNYYKTGLADVVTTGKLLKDIDYYKAEKELEDQKEEDMANKNKRDREKQYLGINKIVVFNPYLADYGLKDEVRDVKSENQKVQLNKMFSKNYSKLDMETYLVDSKSLTVNDVDKYNEIGILNTWINEIIEHDELEMLSSSNDKVKPIQEKYGTEHFLFPGLIKYKDRNEFTMMHLYGILFFYTAPIAIADLLIIHNHFEMFAISINSENDSIEYFQGDQVQLKANNLVMEAYIYNILYNLNKTKK
jgi:Zn-dependent protease with chaperone function